MPNARSNLLPAALLQAILVLTACGGGHDNNIDAAPLPPAPHVGDELFELGRALFFDKVLSGNQDVACASCHHPSLGTDDDLALSRGVGAEGIGAQREGGVLIARNAPALFNLHAYPAMFWDSRVEIRDGHLSTPAGDQVTVEMEATLSFGVVAAQALFPVTSPTEMRGAPGTNELAQFADDDFQGVWTALMARLGEYPAYVEMFERAYPGTPFSSMTFAHAANAIAGYEIRAFERIDSPYQRFLEGDENALSEDAQRGREQFADAGCGQCHSGPLLSDFEHHNTGLAQFGPGSGHGADGLDDYGREGVTGDARDRYAFRTTPLINIRRTGPFGHAGQFSTLESFINHYDDAERELRQYDVSGNVSDATLWALTIDNRAAVEAGIDRDVRHLRRINEGAIAAFLRETSPSTDDLSPEAIPEAVPSGLPID